MSAINPVLAALVTKLKTTPAVIALVPATGIRTAVPQPPTYPFIWIGLPTEVKERTFGEDVQNGTVQVHAYSTQGGPKEAVDILTAAETALDGASLAVNGHTLLNLEIENTFDAGDEVVSGVGISRHYVSIYRVWTQ
jgi:hypothetical protein